MSWRQFLRLSLSAATLLGLAIFGFILIMDPYQTVPFSPRLARAPISQNQRYSYPALARDPVFDSAVIGTSTVRLLNPARLDSALHSRFVNLAMNSATAYEQLQMTNLFIRNHPHARYLILGIDDSWCKRGTELQRYTMRDFPEWMYDDNRWNDLAYLFNDKALENAVRMLELIRDKRSPKYGLNGFDDFTEAFGKYEHKVVAARLYRAGEPRDHFGIGPLEPASRRPDWQFPALALLPELLSAVPNTTGMALLFVPFHANYLRRVAPSYAECKARINSVLGSKRRVVVVDYMYDTALTRNDFNYWDPLHTTRDVADAVAAAIGAELRGVASNGAGYRTRFSGGVH